MPNLDQLAARRSTADGTAGQPDEIRSLGTVDQPPRLNAELPSAISYRCVNLDVAPDLLRTVAATVL